MVHPAMPCAVVSMGTPDGDMFVTVIENPEEDMDPTEVLIHIGKSGSNLTAWADACARLCSLALEHGASLEEIYEELSGINTDKLAFARNRIPVRSGPDGLAMALLIYSQDKEKKKKKNLPQILADE